MTKTKMGALAVFFRNLKQGLGMIFTIRRRCRNCGNVYNPCHSKTWVCFIGGERTVEPDDYRDCGDWRPEF